jgi:hypothetical protein
MIVRCFIVPVIFGALIAAGQAPLTNAVQQISLTGVAAFSPKKWAFVTVRNGTQETRLTLKEGEEKAGIKLHSVNAEAAQARVTINGVERTLSFGAPLPGPSPEALAKEQRDREHAMISALRAQQDRERDAQELRRYLETLRKNGIPTTEEISDEN